MIKKLYTNNKTIILQASIIFILTMAVYANSIHNEFTNWDDNGLIVNNTSIRSLDLKNIISILTPHKGSTFQPIRVLSYAIDYHISKLNPVTFHIHNMILHGFVAIFLYLLLIEIIPLIGATNFKNKKSNIKNETLSDKNNKIDFYRNAAFLTALLFAIHPINVEAVTWMSGRKYTLLTFWGFAAFLLFVKSSKNNTFHPIAYIFSFIFTIIAILSSPFGIVFPVLFFLFDYCRDTKLNPFSVFKKRFIYFAPYFTLSIFFLIIFFQTIIRLGGEQGGTGGAMTGRHTVGVLPFIYTTFRVIFDYLRNLIIPFWLANRYTDFPSYSIFQTKVVISILIILTSTIITITKAIKGKRLLLFCFGWTFITWLPSSNIIPISTLMADRYFYLSSPGLLILFSVTIVTLFSKIKKYNQRKIGFVIFIVILSGYLIPFTLQANRVWKNSETLWRNCLKKHPNYLVYVALSNALIDKADIYKKEGKLDEAVALLIEATNVMPNNPDAFVNLGLIAERFHDYTNAVLYYSKVLEFNPEDTTSMYNRAVMLEKVGHINKAIKQYLKLLESKPNHSGGHNNIGAIYFRNGNFDKAIIHFQKFLKAEPFMPLAHYNLAVCYMKQNKKAKALNYFRATLLIDPKHKGAQSGIRKMTNLLIK